MASAAEIRRKFDELERGLDDLRLLVLGESAGAGTDPEGWVRFTQFLRAFYDAPERRLLPGQARQAAKAAGYNPQGTSGFYSGKGAALKVDGDHRRLTAAGVKAYQANAWRLSDKP